ncbi:MAG TPA: hypothetical protein VF490_14155 [Chryseosolibacter sp.]
MGGVAQVALATCTEREKNAEDHKPYHHMPVNSERDDIILKARELLQFRKLRRRRQILNNGHPVYEDNRFFSELLASVDGRSAIGGISFFCSNVPECIWHPFDFHTFAAVQFFFHNATPSFILREVINQDDTMLSIE